MRILMICTGNMCRSPLAEAILRAELDKAGVDDVVVESAGTGAWEGRAASDGALLVGLENDLDISAHRSRHLSRDIVEQADIIFTMSRRHTERVKKLGGDGKAFLLGEYAGLKRSKAEIADPYGMELEVYRGTFDRLQSLLRTAASRLKREKDDSGHGN